MATYTHNKIHSFLLNMFIISIIFKQKLHIYTDYQVIFLLLLIQSQWIRSFKNKCFFKHLLYPIRIYRTSSCNYLAPNMRDF